MQGSTTELFAAQKCINGRIIDMTKLNLYLSEETVWLFLGVTTNRATGPT